MMGVVPRAVMTLAVHCLGDRRREWAAAMQVEFEAAADDGRALAFAFGCLITAWRELPAHEEGRLAIASHVLAFLLVIPMAALLVSSILTGFPYSYFGYFGIQSLGELFGEQEPLLSNGNRSAVPSLAFLVLLLAWAKLRLAWLILERDWIRVAATGMLLASVTVTLVIFTGVVFDCYASALVQAPVLGIEFAAILALARWHAQLSRGTAQGTLEW